jgi:hypothetical protein
MSRTERQQGDGAARSPDLPRSTARPDAPNTPAALQFQEAAVAAALQF